MVTYSQYEENGYICIDCGDKYSVGQCVYNADFEDAEEIIIMKCETCGEIYEF